MFRPRVAELLLEHRAASCPARWWCAASSGSARPGWSSDLAAAAPVLARAAGGAAGRAGVRQQLRLDLAAARPGHLRRRPAGRPSPTSRSCTCRWSPRSAAWTPALEETARGLGLPAVGGRSGGSSCRSCASALLGGSLLVALHLLAEFGALQMLRYPDLHHRDLRPVPATFNGPGATMLAGVLVLLCLVPAARRAAAARDGGATPAPAAGRAPRPPGGPGRLTAPALARCWPALVGLALVVPWAAWPTGCSTGSSTTLSRSALATTTGTTLGAGGRGRGGDRRPGAARPAGWRSAPAAGSARCSSAAPTSAARCRASSSPWRWSRSACASRRGCTRRAGAARRLRDPFLPRAIVTVRSAVEQSPPLYDDVAASLGSSARTGCGGSPCRCSRPGIGAGAALVFLAVVTELTATLLLAPTGTLTLATAFWSASSALDTERPPRTP